MHLKPKKRLGQNFLFDKNIQRKIIAACELKPSDTVLEIGAGYGELTQLIADKVNKVYALEIDSELCKILKDNFKECRNLTIINQDILKFNFKRYFRNTDKIKVVGNIPYYITTPIIEQLINFRDKIDAIFITVQKEFARRMAAQAGSDDYGSFSCFAQYYTQPKIIFVIKKTCFSPMPKVDSCFLRLEIRPKPAQGLRNERLFFKIIRTAFNHRRKTLRNSLRGIISAQKLERFFAKYSLNSNIRPEALALKDFANLSNL